MLWSQNVLSLADKKIAVSMPSVLEVCGGSTREGAFALATVRGAILTANMSRWEKLDILIN